MNKVISAIVVSAIIVIAITSIALFSVYDSDDKSEKVISDLPIAEKLTTTQDENSKNYQNAQMIVNVVIENYDKNNHEIESIMDELGFNINSANKKYVFVYEMETKNIVGHPNPDLIGKNVFSELITTNEPLSQIDSELLRDGESIMTYNWINPETSTEQLKKSYLKLHDDLVFGSGYFEN